MDALILSHAKVMICIVIVVCYLGTVACMLGKNLTFKVKTSI